MRLSLVTALIALAGATACANDSSTTPNSSAPPDRGSTASIRRNVLTSAITINPLQRITPLQSPQTVSKRIGSLGGTLSLPGAGLTVVVPPLAVLTPVTMTVTAVAGSDVAYEFSPHGLQFLTPVVATQDLNGTEAGPGGQIDPLLLFVGYFPDDNNITSVTELLSLQINLLQQTSTALLPHFSGYSWACGEEGATMSRRPANPVNR